MVDELSVPGIDELRRRWSVKWSTYGEDVLPLFVAEMDYALAPVVAESLHDAIARSDAGYAPVRGAFQDSYAGFADRHWGWTVDPGNVTPVTDVGVGVVELLRVLTEPGDAVVISPPVYPPFFEWLPEAGTRVVEAPLGDDFRLDLGRIEDAFRNRPKVYLLCNPQNPVGRVHTRDELRELVRLASHYGVTLISDEIHAPLVLGPASYTPLLSVEGAAEVGIAVVSASKAFNLAGLKCAAIVTDLRSVVGRLPREVPERTGILGLIASTAAFAQGDAWLSSLLATLRARRSELDQHIKSQLPYVRWTAPEATYLAWLDCSYLGREDEPRERFLAKGVALVSGPSFGREGGGFVRLNFATAPEILAEAIDRMATA